MATTIHVYSLSIQMGMKQDGNKYSGLKQDNGQVKRKKHVVKY